MFDNLEELKDLSEKEKELALKILEEYSKKGSSIKLNKLLYEDYEEIPVTMNEFLHNPHYLGNGLIDEEGRFTIFPYWENLLKEIYPDPIQPARYNTLALTGAIGLGKSTIAVIIGCYELYRMMCLKNPYTHYGLMPTDLITFAVLNITMDAAKGVAWSKLQSLIQSSKWFMDRGTVSKSDIPEWKPPKGIELIYGSQTRHVIGRAVFWCLDGDTIIKTSDGEFKIKELENKPIKVYNVSNDGELLLSDICTVKMTGKFKEYYEIELEDGSLIKCTDNHRFMLEDGSYKKAKDLNLNDILADIQFNQFS